MMQRKYTILSLIIICMLMASCKKKEAQKEAMAYKTMTVNISDQTLKQEYTARLTGKQIVEIRPQVSGNITRICIN